MCGYYETRWYYESNVEFELGFTNQISFTSKSHNANMSRNTHPYPTHQGDELNVIVMLTRWESTTIETTGVGREVGKLSGLADLLRMSGHRRRRKGPYI